MALIATISISLLTEYPYPQDTSIWRHRQGLCTHSRSPENEGTGSGDGQVTDLDVGSVTLRSRLVNIVKLKENE
jgi:hypothetical protein